MNSQMAALADISRRSTTAMSWSRASGISVASSSEREFPKHQGKASDRTLGLGVASSVSVVTPGQSKEADTMVRSTITRPPKRQRQPRFEEQRPVLQLPLAQPEWRAPEVAREERDRDLERGVAVVDFYI